MRDKNAVDAEDRKRFAFVNSIVKEVEVRETLSSETTGTDKLDAVLTNPIAGILFPSFKVIYSIDSSSCIHFS